MSVAVRGLATLSLLINLGAAVPLEGAAAARALEVGGNAVVATTEGDVLAPRVGPGTGFAALTAFAAGMEVRVLDGPVGGDGRLWYQVAGDGLVGWCAADWLAPPAAASGARLVGGGAGGVRLRDEPGLTGGIILVIPEGQEVALLGADAYADGIDWALVRYAGTIGWVVGGFLVAAFCPLLASAGTGTERTEQRDLETERRTRGRGLFGGREAQGEVA